MQKLPLNIAIDKIQKYCSYQERCSYDVQTKLKLFGLDREQTKKILDQLKEAEFLNDERYVKTFTRGKFRIKKWGRKKIYFELKKKNLPDDLIKRSLAEISKDEYERLITDLIDRKWQEINETNVTAKRTKLGRFLISRGFEENIIWEYLKKKS